MHPARLFPPLPLNPDERSKLEQWASGRDRRLARRASIVLGFANGEETKALARRFRLSEPTALKWRMRFDASRLAGLVDAPRSGAPRRILAEDVGRVIAFMRRAPPAGQARWTTRTLARACGVSQTTVSRIWRAHGIDPRAGTLPSAPQDRNEGTDRGQPASASAGVSRNASDSELARLARELAEMRLMASPEQVPFLRVALEALEAAIAASRSPRLRATRDTSRQVWARTKTAIAQARTLVEEARSRVAGLKDLTRQMDAAAAGSSRNKPLDE